MQESRTKVVQLPNVAQRHFCALMMWLVDDQIEINFPVSLVKSDIMALIEV